MEKKNPLEDLRTEIIKSRSSGSLDEFTQAGISNEILDLCDALDSFYGIDRSPKMASSNTKASSMWDVIDQNYKSNSVSNSVLNSMRVSKQWNYSRTNTLIQKSKESLISLKEKLSIENPLYINLSSMIVSIALQDVVSSVNSFQDPKSANISYCGQNSGFRYYYYLIIKESLEVIRALKDFDMTEDCKHYYEENRKELETITQEINQEVLGRESSTRAKSSGCMVFIIFLFASILSIGEIIVLL